ncbi:MAG: 4'-phosphopantetheinyl transferase superfamily protein [Clostridia bacterium]|nr:4'-phosphopantetheinyl transferase superfamily protein [Clostridia bacterium]
MQAVYILDIKDIAKNESKIVPYLSKTAVEKADGFSDKEDKFRSFGGALLIRAFTAESPIKYNENGKPFKDAPPFFNVSHSGEKVGIFVSDDGMVGFDVQRITGYNEKLKNYAFNAEEKAAINSDADFTVFWAMKEAAIKCFGISIVYIRDHALSEIKKDCLTFNGKKLYYKNRFDGEYAFTACSIKAVKAEFLNISVDFALKTLAKKA